MRELFLGIDIGGTKTAVLLVDRHRQILGKTVERTAKNDTDAFTDGLFSIINQTLAAAQHQPEEIAAIGIGIPGQVDSETGGVRHAVNLGLDRFPLRAIVSDKYNTLVYTENDLHNAALGAFHFLVEKQPLQSMVYLGVGTGIAAGLIIDQKVYGGAQQMAGEIGHIILKENGPLCNCGQRGCLEALAAGPAIIRHANQRLDSIQVTHSGEVYQLAATGNQAAQAVIQEVSRYLARAVQIVTLTVDVEKIVIGGGVSRSGDAFLKPIRQELANMRRESPLVTALIPDDKITLLPSNFSAGAWGAVHLAQKEENKLQPKEVIPKNRVH